VLAAVNLNAWLLKSLTPDASSLRRCIRRFAKIKSVKTSEPQPPDDLEEILGYHFRDSELLAQAMTHRSWAHEQVSPRAQPGARHLHNEALEFLGDSILGLIVANYLFKAYPGASEGELSRMKHRLVSEPTLAKASTELRLGEFVRFGRGEEKSGGRRKHALLADVFEAVTGAIFLDGGLEAASDFVELALGEDLRTADPVAAAAADPKTTLQEKLQATRQPGPQYTVIETLGPPHRRMFHVELKWDGGFARGEGSTIKAAEAAAAQAALKQMDR
jgi:ribonuclease III